MSKQLSLFEYLPSAKRQHTYDEELSRNLPSESGIKTTMKKKKMK